MRIQLVLLVATFFLTDLTFSYAQDSVHRSSGEALRVVISIPLTIARANHVTVVLQKLFPKASIHDDAEANAVLVSASPSDLEMIRAIATALDVKNPVLPTSEVLSLTSERPGALASQLRSAFPRVRFVKVGREAILVIGVPAELAQVRAVVAAVDVPPVKPTGAPDYPSTAYHIGQGEPRSVARALARAIPRLKVAVSGAGLIVKGPPEAEAQVKPLLEQLDRPATDIPYVAVYKLANVDASSVADLLARSFSRLTFVVTKGLNAISVRATTFEQTRIADAVSQLDAAPQASSQQNGFAAPGTSDAEVVSLHAAVPGPGANGGASTSANDIAQTVTQALAGTAGDLKITVQPNSTRLILSGNARSRELARNLIAQLDVADPLVELDTRVLEIDEGKQTQLGLKFPTAALATTYTEIVPTNANGGNADFLKLQGITRTPLSLGAQLDFLIANNEARILEDPRITTFSGRTATLRAGETVNILTTAGGGTGTVATTQIQSFQTGVTLDITPVVNADDYVTVTLHPSVNSIAGIGTSGVPNIQTRDTTTTVGLHDGETLIVGGLIEDTDTKTIQKIPLLGDLPLIGRLFQDVGTSHTRNELVVTVTPHILKPGDVGAVSRLQLAPTPLPTVASSATLPPYRNSLERGVPSPAAPILNQHPDSVPSASPAATATQIPSAFSLTNTFTYGVPPQDNYADASQPPRIYYIRVQPTVVKSGVPVVAAVLTTTNVTSLRLGPPSSTHPVTFKQVAPGKWQATFPFDPSELPSTSGNVSEVLTASNAQGTTTTVSVPFSIPP